MAVGGGLRAAALLALLPCALALEPSPAGLRFMELFKKIGGTVGGIEVVSFPGSGLGVRATRDLPKGTQISRMPLGMIVEAANVLSDPEIGPTLKPLASGRLSAMDALAIWLAQQRKQGERSFAEPWLGLFPGIEEMPDPLRWAGSDAAGGALQASPLRAALEAEHEKLSATVDMINGLDADWARSYTLAEHRWGLTNVVRRSYMIQLQDPADGPDGEWKDVPCLPPLADLFNTGPHATLNADCSTAADSQTFLCFTLRDVRAGEQLLVPYGLGTVESDVGTAAARVKEAAEQGEMRLSELLRDCELPLLPFAPPVHF